jgi:L-malate glycosyltransferase
MRLLHVDSARTWRGGQNQVLLTAQGMSALGHEVTVAACRGGVLAARARAAGLRVVELPFRGDLSPGAALGLLRLLRAEGFDVVQVHDPHAVTAAALAARWAPRTRFVATRRVDFHLKGALSRLKYRAFGRIVAVSRAIARVLNDDGIAADRVRVVYEGVCDRTPASGGVEALVAMGVPTGCLVVGNVAAMTDHKDQLTLLEAAALVLARRRDVRFVVIGDGELRSVLERRARQPDLDGWVYMPGFRTDLDRLIPAFTVFCLSSHMEGLGTTLLDAMAFGRPIVATAAGGIPEAVRDGVNGLVVPIRDPARLAEALLTLLGDNGRREAMGREGRQLFEREFSAQRMVEATLAVYRELL